MTLKLSTLKFSTLRRANLARLTHLKTAQGEPAHSQADGSDWSLGEWVTAVTAELGELANIIKKIKRGDLKLEDRATHLSVADELADVAIYLDILAFRCGVDLGKAIVDKWNLTSGRIGYSGRIYGDTFQQFETIGENHD